CTVAPAVLRSPSLRAAAPLSAPRSFPTRRSSDLEKIPGITFSSDIIVGFPGETEEDFEGTLELIRKVGYMQLFTFIYSKRSGTRSEEHTSELQSRFELVCRLLLDKPTRRRRRLLR